MKFKFFMLKLEVYSFLLFFLFLIFFEVKGQNGSTYTVSRYCTWGTSHQGMWGEDWEHFYLNIQQDLFNFNYNQSYQFGQIEDIFGLQFGAVFTINPYILLSSTFVVQGFHNGWVDVNFPVKIDLTFPSPYTFMPGDWITINSKYYIQPGWDLTTHFPNQGIINLDLEYGFGINMSGTICFGTCSTIPIMNYGVPPDSISIIDINTINGTVTYPCMQNGNFTFCQDTILPIVFNNLWGIGLSGYITIPDVHTTDYLDTTSQCNKKILASGYDHYADFDLDILQFLMAVATWLPDSSGQPLIDFINNLQGTINIGGGITITYDLLNAHLQISNYLHQDFTFEPTIWNHFTFPTAVQYYVTDPSNNDVVVESGYSNYIVFKACHDLHFKYPCFGYTQLPINIFHTLTNQFTNHTWDSVTFSLIITGLEFWINIPFFKSFPDDSLNTNDSLFKMYIIPRDTILNLDSLKKLISQFYQNNFNQNGDDLNLKSTNKSITLLKLTETKLDSILSEIPDSILIGMGSTKATYHIGPLINYTIPLGYIPITWFNDTWQLEGMEDTCGYFQEVLYSLPEMSVSMFGKKCYEDEAGTYTVIVNNGKPPYTYEWSSGIVEVTSDTFNIQTGFGYGTEYVTVTDANGCSLVASSSITSTNPEITYQFNVSDAPCYGLPGGSIQVIPGGGTPPYTFTWNTGDTLQYLQSLYAGTYYVTITDAIGCTATASVTISQPESYVSIQVDSIVKVECIGGSTGAIYITPQGGTPDYTYIWSNGSSNQDLVNLPSGTYVLTIIDANGCSLVETFIVPQVPHCCLYPNAGIDKTVCGYIATLEGNIAPPGITSVWQYISGPGQAIINNPGAPDATVMVNTQGTYTFVWHFYSHYCDTLDTVKITFITQPVANAGPPHVLVCGTSYTLNAIHSVPGSTGYWQLLPPQTGTFMPNSNVNNPTFFIGSGYTTYYLVWTEENLGCVSSDTIALEFHEKPSPNVGPDKQVCGNIVELTVESDYPGYWTSTNYTAQFYPSDTSTSVTATVILTQNVQVDTFMFVAQSPYCINSDTLVVYFTKKPYAEAGSPQMVCGNQTTLAADTIGSYAFVGYWTSSHPTITNIEYTGQGPLFWNPQVSVNQAVFDTADYIVVYFYWHVGSSEDCYSYDSVKVTFHKVPDAYAGKDTTVCGKHVFLNATPSLNNSYGLWIQDEGPGTTTFNNMNSPQTMAYVSQYGTYTFIWTEMNSNMPICSDKDTVKITFLVAPEPDAGLDQSVCGNFAYICATPSIPGGYWVGPPGLAFYDSPNGNYNPSYKDSACTWIRWPSQNDTIKLYWVEFNGICYGMDSVSIYFAAIEPAIILNNPADSLVCGNTYSYLNAQAPEFGYGYWIDVVSNTTFYPSPNTPNMVSATIGSGDSYYGPHVFYWITVNGNCRDTSDAFYVNFIKQPNANAGGNYWPGLFGENSDIKTDTVCGCEYKLNAELSVSGATGTWYSLNPLNIVFSNGIYQEGLGWITHVPDDSLYFLGNCFTVFNPNQPYIDLVWQENNKNYCFDSDTLRLYFAPRPTGQFSYTIPACRRDSSIIIANTWPLPNHPDYGIVQFLWDIPNASIIKYSDDEINNSDTLIVWWSSGEEHHISLITVNLWGCYSGIVTQVINEPPKFNPERTIDNAKCNECNGMIELSTSHISSDGEIIQNYYTFLWLDNIEDSTSLVRYNLCPGNYDLVVIGQSLSPHAAPQTFCKDTITIQILDVGAVIALFDTSVFDPDAYAPYSVQMINKTINGKKFSWRLYDENNNFVSMYNGTNPNITFPKEGCYTLVLIAMSKEGCIDTFKYSPICIDKPPLLEVPNVFTPNNDGSNDLLLVKAQSMKEFKATIYNKWGRKVYEWDNPDEGWDGKITGVDAADGVYFIIVKAKDKKGKEYSYKGTIQLLRGK